MKYLCIPVVLFASWNLASAVGQNKKNGPVANGPVPTDPFYPREVGSQWQYRSYQTKESQAKNQAGASSELVTITAEKTVDLPLRVLDAMKKPIEVVGTDKKPVTIRCTRLKVESGQKVLYEDVGLARDGVYRFTSAGKDIVAPLLFFKLPFKAGEKWSVQSLSEDKMLKGTFTAEEDAVQAPAGSFKAKHVFCKDFEIGDQKMEIEYWFAENVGMVQERVKIGGNEIMLKLVKFSQPK